MKEGDELMRYFIAEKQAGALAAALGLLAFAFSSLLWRTGTPLRAMVWPVALVGLVEIGVGAGLILRTDGQGERLRKGLASRPVETRAAELSRMERVNRSFRVIEALEVLLFASPAALLLRARPAWAAAGMGLLVQASVMLVFDLFAERRAHAYTRWLEGLGPPGGGA
ncbi:MAG: hypothetical protein ACRD3M_16540 [Thermoanaerobaculia bacterium]